MANLGQGTRNSVTWSREEFRTLATGNADPINWPDFWESLMIDLDEKERAALANSGGSGQPACPLKAWPNQVNKVTINLTKSTVELIADKGMIASKGDEEIVSTTVFSNDSFPLVDRINLKDAKDNNAWWRTKVRAVIGQAEQNLRERLTLVNLIIEAEDKKWSIKKLNDLAGTMNVLPTRISPDQAAMLMDISKAPGRPLQVILPHESDPN
ncbi:Oidioi.mRNA.OKI2018_I69.XSR.g14569.t1.cds [Oikopleura dioica]|uniref:Oidioi.mRNA.OKI2018_I69.XSR.g14569.t1.cds n=1 Tax=Oikopleura dioica TaxID=34765 RepID=A0ABN7SAQ4_OIKDI|nr:Oidioi.mRNA.OKI2018_I69.XSR.g14569.t1.cds [Oikopleura dioica]